MVTTVGVVIVDVFSVVVIGWLGEMVWEGVGEERKGRREKGPELQTV